MKHCKKILKDALVFMGTAVFLCAGTLHADDDNGANEVPSPATDILIIYNEVDAAAPDHDYSRQTKDNIKAAMEDISTAPNVDVLEVTQGPGIYTDLTEQFGDDLTDFEDGHKLERWGQVWDVRLFTNATGMPTKSDIDAFSIDLGNPRSDYNLFLNYLSAGGCVLLQGEHIAAKDRNEAILTLIKYVTGETSLPAGNQVGEGTGTVSQYNSSLENFDTDFNTLTEKITMPYAGAIPMSRLEKGTPIAHDGTLSYMTAWLAEDMDRVDAGRLILSLDINLLAEDSDPVTALIQNVYDLLSGYRRFDLTKKFDESEIKLSTESKEYLSTFTLTVENEETLYPLSGLTVTDTMPVCLEYISSDKTPIRNEDVTINGVSTTVLEWDIKDLDPGEKEVITVTYKAISTDCE
ncbi:MAG: hypothetical protein ACQEQV_04575 [Fibrobacterota bacterium]